MGLLAAASERAMLSRRFRILESFEFRIGIVFIISFLVPCSDLIPSIYELRFLAEDVLTVTDDFFTPPSFEVLAMFVFRLLPEPIVDGALLFWSMPLAGTVPLESLPIDYPPELMAY